jgi:hypothetical protein
VTTGVVQATKETVMARALNVNENPRVDQKASGTAGRDKRDEKLDGKAAQANKNSVEAGEPIHFDEQS